MYFRMESLEHGLDFITGIFSLSLFTIPKKLSIGLIILVLTFLYVEWLQREKEHALDFSNLTIRKPIRKLIYFGVFLMIFLFKAPTIDFIYFQF